MHKEKDKYQNILNQLHELNRNILLNENEKIEQITQKIDSLEEKVVGSSQAEKKKSNDKIQLLLILISLINSFLLIIILFSDNTGNTRNIEKVENPIVNIEDEKNNSQVDEVKKVKEEKNEEILSFEDNTVIEFDENEEFEDTNPIIRKGTKYTCKNDARTYKIPYTVEIKGKLYLEEFKFILQEDSITKECSIKKDFM